ncbi:MAG: T9SS type A sorting domain-containing protein [Saprospiraceae bacterium]|nr:T9SS type A sorting domain-containing protein [Saprospiraceae bacterium]
MIRTILISLIFLLVSQLTFGQITKDFEFLTHNNRVSRIGAAHIIDEGVLFVSHNGDAPMTTVGIAKPDHTLEILFESGFSSTSNKVMTSDSTFKFFIQNLFDYDIGVPGFHEVNYENGEITIESILTWESGNTENHPYVSSVVNDSMGNYYILDYNGFKFINEDLDVIDFELGENYFGVYKSVNDDIYLRGARTISYFNGNSASVIASETKPIIDILSFSNLNVVLVEGQLNFYNVDFSQKIDSIIIHTDIKEFDALEIEDDLITAVVSESGSHQIITYDFDGNQTVVYETTDEYEDLTGLLRVDDNTLLINGQWVYKNAVRTGFFRGLSLEETSIYPEVYLRLSDYSIVQTDKDSFFIHVIIDGDSIFYYNYYYTLSASLFNDNFTEIYASDVYSRALVNRLGPLPFFHYSLEEDLSPVESIFFEKDIIVSPSSGNMSTLELIVPGGNYQFNRERLEVILPEFTSSVTRPLLSDHVIVYPNPVADRLLIKNDQPVLSYSIYDNFGRLVSHRSSTSDLESIDVSALQSGHYHLQLKGSDSKLIYNSGFVKCNM